MKTFCVLEQGKEVGEPLTLQKKAMFTTEFSDFYRLNWKQDNDPNAFITKKGITYSEGRSLLYAQVPKQYEYYIIMDDDVALSYKNNDIAAKIRDLLVEYKPIAGTFWDPNSWYLNQKDVDVAYLIMKRCFPIRGHDQQVQILSKSLAEVMLPIIYHGSDKCMWYIQWACSQLFPLKQMCFTEIQASNTRNDDKTELINLPQYLSAQSVIRLFNHHIKNPYFYITDHDDIKRKNLHYSNQYVSTEKCTFSIDDFAKIYDTNNYFFKHREPIATRKLVCITKVQLIIITPKIEIKNLICRIKNIVHRIKVKIKKVVRSKMNLKP